MGDRAYTWDRFDLSLFRADARLAYTLVEYGLLGLLLLLSYFTSYFDYFISGSNRNNRKKILVIFSYYCLLTITESGFFEPLLFPLSFIYLGLYCNEES